MRKRIAHLHTFHYLQHFSKRLIDKLNKGYNSLNKLVRRIKELMQRNRDLMFSFLILLIATIIQAIIFLANPYYRPFLEALWSKLHFWLVVLILALVFLIWWVIHTAFGVIGRMDKAKDEQRITEMKQAFIQALEETSLAKKVNSKQKSENKLNNQTGTKK